MGSQVFFKKQHSVSLYVYSVEASVAISSLFGLCKNSYSNFLLRFKITEKTRKKQENIRSKLSTATQV